MNWMDILIIVILGACVFWGAKTGLFGAAFYAVTIFVGWLIAIRVSQTIGNAFTNNLELDTYITVIVYFVILISSLVLARSALKMLGIATMVVDVATLGMNRIFGMVIGLTIGVLMGAIVITGLARFTYDFDISKNMSQIPNIPGQSLIPSEKIGSKVEETKIWLESGFTDSTIAPIYIKIISLIPNETVELLPDDFNHTLDLLDSKL